MRVATVGTISALKGIGTRHSRENRRNAFHVFAKTHVVVPLVIDGERFDPGTNRVVRKQLEIRRPVGVHGPVCLEVASDPLQEVLARRTFRHLHAIVKASQPDATLHHLVELFQMIVQ